MNLIADRNGHMAEENSLQDRFLEWMYGHVVGRMLLRPLISPAFSKLGGYFLNSRISVLFIKPFIRGAKIDMSVYEKKKYISYNDFFTRKLIPGARPVGLHPEELISPCDGRLGVFKITEHCSLTVKHTRYSVASLLQDRKLAEEYAGGYLWIFRLCVDDYHRYVHVDSGITSPGARISGVFHTVNPVANDCCPIYKENTREYTFLQSANFGRMIQMEVGALLVGKIENRDQTGFVRRGEEKGNFAFGGSTIILLTKKDTVCPDTDILENSSRGIETRVLLGETVGKKYKK